MISLPRRHVLRSMCAAGGVAAIGVLGSRIVAAQSPREIEVVAQRFKFTPNEITLKHNERVVLLVRSLDFVHGFSVPDLRVRADLVPGRVTRIPVHAEKLGVLEFVCDNFCGDAHEEMHGRFIVTGNAE
jgi:cytochrome c oxidase subunit II